VGDACTPDGTLCDPVDGCNTLYQCTDTDPAVDCPISKAKHKEGVRLLTAEDLSRIEQELHALPLANWRYRWTPVGAPPRLGFIIDGALSSHAVRPNGEQVDLYAYTTMAIATIRAQSKTIETLEQRLGAIEEQLSAQR